MAYNNEELWNNLGIVSSQFEHSMNALHRKQTGSYYTDLALTFSMMKELVNSLTIKQRNNLYSKTFLEPCVGTGNFVFAYLRVCKELMFSKAQYEQLINNIYVCDINSQALQVYKENLTILAKEYFEITLDDEYFRTHIGGGLLINVDSPETKYIPISDVFPAEIIKDGFDFVVTNPPYKNFKAERGQYDSQEQYEDDKNKYAEIGRHISQFFNYSCYGIINIYKLFVEEITEKYLASDGVCSLLIPSSILSDKTCSKIRTRLLNTCSIKSIRIISEDSKFVDASQALCSLLIHKGAKSKLIYVDGSFSGNDSKGLFVNVDDIIDESTGNAILVLDQHGYAIRKRMKSYPSIKELPFIVNMRGELDLTINDSAIRKEVTPYRLLRGRNIGFYKVIESEEKEYVSNDFVDMSSKNAFIHKERLVCQQIANMAKKRRIAFTLVPPDCVLGNSCNFISVQSNQFDVNEFFLLGILNSKLIDWYFKLSSSNNHINNYEIDNFPIPVDYNKKQEIESLVKKYINNPNDEILNQLDILVCEAYGINTEIDMGEINNSDMSQGFINDKNSILNRFFDDISKVVSDLTIESCTDIILNKRTLKDVYNFGVLDSFTKKVVNGIEDKYKKLYNSKILNHTTFKLSPLDLEMIKHVPQGGNWKDIPQETVKKSKRLVRITQTGGRTTLYGRVEYSKPSYTITTYFNRPGNGTYVHPVHERVLSVREAARFQCFPDDYLFYGNKTDMLKQVGNAVPVMLAYNLGKAIKEKTGCSTSVDLFSGAGGMTYGFKLAGIKAVVANDIEENACVTLKVNSPEIPVYCGDITKEETKNVLIQAGRTSGADIICGGPPCQGFSMAGWRMKDDPRNQLFRHFVDIVSGVNPKVIVFENVEGLLSYEGGETYKSIIELFSELGYYTEGRKLMANHYGAPQRRKRVIILCTRKDINIKPSDIFPAPITPNSDRQVSAYETIFDLENVPCSDDAEYNSQYSSPMIRFFKNECSAESFLEAVKDSRGILGSIENEITESDMIDTECTTTKKKKRSKKFAEEQLCLEF